MQNLEITGFEHIHLHTTTGSVLDGFGEPEEYANKWKQHGDYLVFSDHGSLAAIPRQIKACDPSWKKDDPYRDKKLIPIFAMEGYVNPLQIQVSSEEERKKYTDTLSPDERAIFNKSYHLLMIAYNQIGYKNLVKLSSWGWLYGLYRNKPRVNYEQLMKYKEGLIFTSCCYASEIGQAFDKGGEETGFAMIEKYHKMFQDNFYLEIMLLDFSKQKPYDKFIIKAHEKYGIPIEITNDCHYCNKEDSKYQRYMLMCQTKNTVKSIEKKMKEEGMKDFFELQDSNLWMKTEEELNEKWYNDYRDILDYDLFKQCKRTTVEICRKAGGVNIDRSMKLPVLFDANDRLKEEMVKGFKLRKLPRNQEYLSRLKEEYELICSKEFSSYFLILKEIIEESRRVCPGIIGFGNGSETQNIGRGSSVGSLICYCLRITDVDPIKHDLLFSRFLSPSRGGKSVKLRF